MRSRSPRSRRGQRRQETDSQAIDANSIGTRFSSPRKSIARGRRTPAPQDDEDEHQPAPSVAVQDGDAPDGGRPCLPALGPVCTGRLGRAGWVFVSSSWGRWCPSSSWNRFPMARRTCADAVRVIGWLWSSYAAVPYDFRGDLDRIGAQELPVVPGAAWGTAHATVLLHAPWLHRHVLGCHRISRRCRELRASCRRSTSCGGAGQPAVPAFPVRVMADAGDFQRWAQLLLVDGQVDRLV